MRTRLTSSLAALLGMVVVCAAAPIAEASDPAQRYVQSGVEARERAKGVAQRDCDVRPRCVRFSATRCIRHNKVFHSCRVTIYARERSGRGYRCTRIIGIRERRFDWVWRPQTSRECYYGWKVSAGAPRRIMSVLGVLSIALATMGQDSCGTDGNGGGGGFDNGGGDGESAKKGIGGVRHDRRAGRR